MAQCLLRVLTAQLNTVPRRAACSVRALARATSDGVRGAPRAVRAVPIRLLSVSKGGGSDFDGVVGEYSQRIQRYTSFEELTLRPNPKGAAATDAAAQSAAEGERLVRSVGARDRLVLLDERGRDVSSEQLAQMLASAGDDDVSALVFAVGGPHGHGPAAHQRADFTMRLSAMVLNHQVARVVLVEQLYRAWTILRGEGYHHS